MVHEEGSAAQVRLEAIQVVLQCSEEAACEWLEEVVEDLADGWTELLGHVVTQERTRAADKQEVMSHIESAASKARAVSEAKEVLRETRQRVASEAKVAPAVGRQRRVAEIEPDHDWSEQHLTKKVFALAGVSRE